MNGRDPQHLSHQHNHLNFGRALTGYDFCPPNATVSCAGAVVQHLSQSPNSKPAEASRQRQLDGMLGEMPDQNSATKSCNIPHKTQNLSNIRPQQVQLCNRE
jgi:hypothetical protein